MIILYEIKCQGHIQLAYIMLIQGMCPSFCQNQISNSKVPQNLGKKVLEAVVLAVNAAMNAVPQFKGFSLKDGNTGQVNKTMYNFFYMTRSFICFLLEAQIGIGMHQKQKTPL